MKGFENNAYLIGYIISNLVAIFLLVAAWKWPRFTRLLFSLLFAWASIVCWITVVNNPGIYMDYAELSILSSYKEFINGWFSDHVLLVIGCIATLQAMISVSMLLRGWVYKTGCMLAIMFLLAMLPLGIGSGIPCTLIMALAVTRLHKFNHHYFWYVPRRMWSR